MESNRAVKFALVSEIITLELEYISLQSSCPGKLPRSTQKAKAFISALLQENILSALLYFLFYF